MLLPRFRRPRAGTGESTETSYHSTQGEAVQRPRRLARWAARRIAMCISAAHPLVGNPCLPYNTERCVPHRCGKGSVLRRVPRDFTSRSYWGTRDARPVLHAGTEFVPGRLPEGACESAHRSDSSEGRSGGSGHAGTACRRSRHQVSSPHRSRLPRHGLLAGPRQRERSSVAARRGLVRARPACLEAPFRTAGWRIVSVSPLPQRSPPCEPPS